MSIFIEHYVSQAWGISPKTLNSRKALLGLALRIAKDLNLTVVRTFIHKFKPHGLSLILIISESHLAIHTWPESGYLHVDILSCSKSADLSKLEEVLKKELNPEKISTSKIKY